MIPLFADLRGKRVVICGGGRVAVRKAAFFAGEADVCVVSRSHAREMETLPVKRSVLDVSKSADGELGEVIDGAFIVVSALPDKAQNDRIGELCRQKGILFNNADGSSGDLIVPSVSSGEQYTVAFSTHGKSPAVSRFIREYIDRSFALLDPMIALQDALRTELKRTVPSQERRQEILRQVVCDPEVWDALSRSGEEGEAVARRKHLHG